MSAVLDPQHPSNNDAAYQQGRLTKQGSGDGSADGAADRADLGGGGGGQRLRHRSAARACGVAGGSTGVGTTARRAGAMAGRRA